MANDIPSWAATCALLANRLMALDKCPDIRSIGIDEIWRWLLAKCILKIAGTEAKDTCSNVQLCTGLESETESAVHVV